MEAPTGANWLLGIGKQRDSGEIEREIGCLPRSMRDISGHGIEVGSFARRVLS